MDLSGSSCLHLCGRRGRVKVNKFSENFFSENIKVVQIQDESILSILSNILLWVIGCS